MVILISLALGSSPTVAQGGGRPILLLTENGKVVVKIVGPKGATDLEIFWGGKGVPEGGYGYWTQNGKEMPKSRFVFLANINDIHFSPSGRVPRLPPTQAPAGANDIEIRWEGYRIVEVWWTRDGERMSRIPLGADTQELNFQFNREATQQAASATTTTPLVGVVYDRNSRPGDKVTMSFTENPKRYENISGLGVVVMKGNVPRDASGQVNLAEVTVNLGDGRQQPANQPLILRLPQTAGNIPIEVSRQAPTPFAQANLPIPQGGAVSAVANTGSPSDFTTAPVCQDTSFIRGPLSGDVPRIMVDHQPASIIAESPTSVYFDLPPGISAGPHQLVLQDGARSASFPIVRMGISGDIDQSELQRGQKTNYSVTVNLGQLPDSFWRRGGGMSPEIMNPSKIQQAAPGIHIPQAGEPGGVLLVVSNGSPGVVKINEVVRVLHQQDFKNNQFTTGGEIQSLRSGGFVLNLLAATLFAPISGREVPGGVIAGEGRPVLEPTPTPTPRTPTIAEEEEDKCKNLECNAPSPSTGGNGIPFLTCKACATCAPSPCECQLWRRKNKKGDPLGDPEFVAKQGKATKKEDDYAYYCSCSK